MKSKNKKAIALAAITAIIAVSVFIAIPSIASELSNKTVTIDTSSASKVKNILQIENVKSNLTDAQKKLSTDLLQLVNSSFLPEGQNRETLEMQMERLGQFRPASSVSSTSDGRVAGELVYVYVYLKPPAGTRTIEPFVWEVTDRDEKNHLAVAWVGVKDLETLASLDAVRTIRTVMPPLVRTGSVTTEGDAIHRTSNVRASYSQSGSGVKVGIISDGVDNWAVARDSGDLPAGLTILSNTEGGDEGTAMLEIVHDMVPEADLYFHDAGANVVAFNAAIDALVTAGCNVICDDIGWLFEPFFEDGIIASHLTLVLASNDIVYVSSAGNDGNKHYQGDHYNDGYNYHDFSRGSEPVYKYLYVEIPNNGEVTVVLQWNDEFGFSGNDYDLYLYDTADWSILDYSEYTQDGDDDPLEVFSYTNTGGSTIDVEIDVYNYNGAAATKTLEVFIYPSNGAWVYTVNIDPADSIFGHPAVPNAIAVGAIAASDPGNDEIEPFSSQGPVTISHPSPVSRSKPDLCGIDGVTVTGAGGFSSPFYGTSAAAPHIAAIAAQLWGAYPDKTGDEIRTTLCSSAVDLGSAGYDSIFGYGRADALDAFEGENQPPYKPSNPSPFDGATNVSITADLSWTGGDPDSWDTVTYDVYFEAGDNTPDELVSANQTETTYDLGALNYSTHYYWKIAAKDKWGKSTISDVWDFTSERDTTPPASITSLNASDIGLTWINWTWTKPTDDDFNHTMVYLNGNWRTNTSSPYYNATGLNPDTSYEIGAHTVDKLGNINTTWVNQTNKTLSDKTPPTYSQVSSDNTEVGEPALLSAYWCDDIGLNGFNLSTNNSGSWINTSYPMTGQCNWSNATIILNSTAHLTICWIFYAKDTFGNWNNTGVQTILTADTKPPIVTSATANPPVISADGAHGTLLNVTATDISGIKSVTVNLSSIGRSETQELQNNNGVWQCTTNATKNGTFELPVNVTDNEGNSNTTATISLETVPTRTDLIFTYRDSSLTTPAGIFEDNATVFVVVTDGHTTGGNKTIIVNNTYNEVINVTVYDNGTNYDATADDKNYTCYFNITSGVTNDNTDELRLNEGDTATITANLANDGLVGTKKISRATKCFIATAAYGTSLHENIDILRSFRDKVLMQTSPGGALVTTYYSTSPPIADALAKNEGLRSAVRLLLLTPLVYFAERILSGIGLIAVVFLGLGAFFGRRRYIKIVLKAIGLGLSTAVALTGIVFALGWLAYTYPVCAVISAHILPLIIPAAIGAGAMVLVLWKPKNHEVAQD